VRQLLGIRHFLEHSGFQPQAQSFAILLVLLKPGLLSLSLCLSLACCALFARRLPSLFSALTRGDGFGWFSLSHC
jgi:hypothetical protein